VVLGAIEPELSLPFDVTKAQVPHKLHPESQYSVVSPVEGAAE